MFAVSLGSRDAANFASMVLHSLLGLAQAQSDLHCFVEDQLGNHPLTSLLTQCTDPPPVDDERLARTRAFHALFEIDK